MSNRRAFRLALLDKLYSQIPPGECTGDCGKGADTACGPIPLTQLEYDRIRDRLAQQGRAHILDHVNDSLICPMLKDGRCSVYDIRPTICRLWGVVDSRLMRCRYGCRPKNMMQGDASIALLKQAGKIGGRYILIGKLLDETKALHFEAEARRKDDPDIARSKVKGWHKAVVKRIEGK